mmetsp:Transcript_12576/g.26627  ORF Transcript_12576/g.26627 Transcript_12576/m.26627 type:complete len:345 (+) Transcript_12576:829-1863(+)
MFPAGHHNGTLGRCPRSFLLQVQNGPVEHVVVLESLAIKEFLEEPLEVGVIGTVLEAEGSAVFEIRSEFRGVSLTELFRAGRHFSVHDAFVLLLFGVGFESLPGKRPADEIHQDVTQRLEVVPAALLDTDVGVDRGVPRRPGQVLVLAVGYVLVGAGIAVLFGQTEIDNVDDALALAQSDQEIVRFDVSVDEGFRVDVFQPAQQLIGQHQYGLELEPPAAIIEQIFQRGTQEIQDHDVVITLDAVPSHVRNAQSSVQNPVNLALVQQLWVLCFHGFELDSHFFSRGHVGSEVNITEGTAADLPAETVLLSHSQLHYCDAILPVLNGCLRSRIIFLLANRSSLDR